MLSSNAPKFQGIRAPTVSYERINEIIGSYVHTMFIGDVLSFNQDTCMATIDVHNSKPFNSQIVENDQFPAGVPGFWFQPIGQITLRCFCPAFIEATPQEGDTVMCFVPQSSVESYFDGSDNNYAGRFNMGEALVFPIKTGYSSSNTLTINPNYDKITNVVVNAPKFSVLNSTGELLTEIANALTVIGDIIPNPEETLDVSSGGMISELVQKIETFIS